MLRTRFSSFASLALSAVALAAFVNACGGGSSSPAPTPARPTPSPVPTSTPTPRPTPSPTPAPTPTPTGSPQGITFIPPSVTFANKNAQQVTADYPPSQYDQNTQLISNSCGTPPNEKADITQGFDYGFWQISPGPVNGKCKFVIEDLSNPSIQGTEYITNNSN